VALKKEQAMGNEMQNTKYNLQFLLGKLKLKLGWQLGDVYTWAMTARALLALCSVSRGLLALACSITSRNGKGISNQYPFNIEAYRGREGRGRGPGYLGWPSRRPAGRTLPGPSRNEPPSLRTSAGAELEPGAAGSGSSSSSR
jgi:hypothetical protein